MSKVIQRRSIVPNLHLLEIEAPELASKVKPGQFIVVMADEKGERIPLTIADWTQHSITTIFMEVGHSTHKLTKLHPGDSLPVVVGPLGQPAHIDLFGKVICAGGCYGIASIFPIARALKAKGNEVISILEARSKFLLYWEEKLRKTSDQLIIATKDGSRGTRKGYASIILKDLLENAIDVDRIFAVGCTFMMMDCSEATKPFKVPTIVTLNSIMVDGTGMCGACRVSIGGETKFACVDGPHFDGHLVDWSLLLVRRRAYLDSETVSVSKIL